MRILIILTVLLLSGCSMKSFECGIEPGVKCRSLTEVDAITDKTTTAKANVLRPTAFSRIRVPEEVLDIYLNSYVSEDGTLHHAKKISVIAKHAHWK